MGAGFAEAPRLGCSGAGEDIAGKRRTTRPGRSLGQIPEQGGRSLFHGGQGARGASERSVVRRATWSGEMVGGQVRKGLGQGLSLWEGLRAGGGQGGGGSHGGVLDASGPLLIKNPASAPD